MHHHKCTQNLHYFMSIALDVTTPVEIALFTVPEKKLFSGILKERCQFPAGCWLGITANSVSSSLEWPEESCV